MARGRPNNIEACAVTRHLQAKIDVAIGMTNMGNQDFNKLTNHDDNIGGLAGGGAKTDPSLIL